MPITITIKIEQRTGGVAAQCDCLGTKATPFEAHLADFIRESLNELIKFYPTLTGGLYKKVVVAEKDPSSSVPSDKKTDASFGSGCDTAPCILPPSERSRDNETE